MNLDILNAIIFITRKALLWMKVERPRSYAPEKCWKYKLRNEERVLMFVELGKT